MSRTDFPRRVWFVSMPAFTDDYGVKHPNKWASREYDADLDQPRRAALSRLIYHDYETAAERDALHAQINEWAVV